MGAAAEVPHLAAALARPGRGRSANSACSPTTASRRASARSSSPSCAAHLDDIDFARAAEHETRAPARRDGPRPRPRRRRPRRRRDIIHLGATSCYVTDNADLILMREALPTPVRQARGRDRRPGARSPTTLEGRADARLHALPAGAAHDGRQAGHAVVLRPRARPAGARSAAGTSCRSAGRRGRPARRPASSPCSAATTTRSASSTALVAEEDGLRRRLSRSPGRPTRARSMRRCSTPWPASAQSACTSWAPTCGCWPTGRRSTSRSRPSRSARRRWRTSGTRCGPSGCAALARFLMGLPAMAAQTAATQWFERTLDDSAARRLYIPQAFLAADAVPAARPERGGRAGRQPPR